MSSNSVSCNDREKAEKFVDSCEINSDIIKLVHQFLVHHDFQSTAKSLIQEALEMNSNSSGSRSAVNHEISVDLYDQLISCFKRGNWRSFFKLWDALIPESIKSTKEYKVLTLNLHVHFAVLPKRILLSPKFKQQTLAETDTTITQKETENFTTDIEESMNGGMARLQEYLAADGKELEHENQLRPFFALPFIEDPIAEPFLSKIFDQSWLDELTLNLCTFVAKQNKNLGRIEPEKSRSIKTPSNEENARKTSAKTNVPIVPNDRNIPLFLQDNEIREYHFHQNGKRGTQSKSAQTHISGIYTPVQNNVQVHKIYHQDDVTSTDKTDKRLAECSQELTLTKSHLYTIHSNYEKLKLRFHKLHADYHKLIGVAGELTAALENSVRGETVDLQSTLETCIKIFPDLFSHNIRDNSQSLSTLQCDQTGAITQPIWNFMPVSSKFLDFTKIKLHLINGNIKTKLYLLQALRWKITLGQPGERDEAIHEYISNDLLGLHGQIASDSGKSILPYILISTNFSVPQPLQQSAARLLNALASFRCGRDYLSVNSTIVNMTFKCLSNKNDDDGIDAFTCDMLMAMLQKLSLRKQQRIRMINIGMVEWLVCHLHTESCSMGFYRLEYATALLMNLSLHREARTRASTIASLIISTLLTLLSIDHMPALPYVNGALNNFLSNQVINEEAKKMKLSSILEYYRKQKTGEIRKHLDHILKLHTRENMSNTEGEETADDDNEELDVLENQLEENDPVKNHIGELYGEALLGTCYMLSPDSFQKYNAVTDVFPSRPSKLHSAHVQVNEKQQPDPKLQNAHQPVTHVKDSSPRESSKTTVTSNATLPSACESAPTEPEKFSSIASLDRDNGNTSSKTDGKFTKEEEEAFLAKPKIARTPP